jgi:hypothetical protein
VGVFTRVQDEHPSLTTARPRWLTGATEMGPGQGPRSGSDDSPKPWDDPPPFSCPDIVTEIPHPAIGCAQPDGTMGVKYCSTYMTQKRQLVMQEDPLGMPFPTCVNEGEPVATGYDCTDCLGGVPG